MHYNQTTPHIYNTVSKYFTALSTKSDKSESGLKNSNVCCSCWLQQVFCTHWPETQGQLVFTLKQGQGLQSQQIIQKAQMQRDHKYETYAKKIIRVNKLTHCCVVMPYGDIIVGWYHYDDVIMGEIASQIISLTIVYSIVYSDADQRKHQSSASLAFVWGIHPWIPSTKGQLRGKFFQLMMSSSVTCTIRNKFLWYVYNKNTMIFIKKKHLNFSSAKWQPFCSTSIS